MRRRNRTFTQDVARNSSPDSCRPEQCDISLESIHCRFAIIRSNISSNDIQALRPFLMIGQ
jgi:hypothetical protein